MTDTRSMADRRLTGLVQSSRNMSDLLAKWDIFDSCDRWEHADSIEWLIRAVRSDNPQGESGRMMLDAFDRLAAMRDRILAVTGVDVADYLPPKEPA